MLQTEKSKSPTLTERSLQRQREEDRVALGNEFYYMLLTLKTVIEDDPQYKDIKDVLMRANPEKLGEIKRQLQEEMEPPYKLPKQERLSFNDLQHAVRGARITV